MSAIVWLPGEGLRCRRAPPQWWETIVVVGPSLWELMTGLSPAVSRWPHAPQRPWQVWVGVDSYQRAVVGMPRPAPGLVFAPLLEAVQTEGTSRRWEYDVGDQLDSVVQVWPEWRPWAVWTGAAMHLFMEWNPAWTIRWSVRDEPPDWRWSPARLRWAVAHAALRAVGIPPTRRMLEQFYWVYFRQMDLPRWTADPQDWPPLPLGLPAEAEAVARRLHTERWGTWRQWAQVYEVSTGRLRREASEALAGHGLTVFGTADRVRPWLECWPLSSLERWRSRFHPDWPAATPERFDALAD